MRSVVGALYFVSGGVFGAGLSCLVLFSDSHHGGPEHLKSSAQDISHQLYEARSLVEQLETARKALEEQTKRQQQHRDAVTPIAPLSAEAAKPCAEVAPCAVVECPPYEVKDEALEARVRDCEADLCRLEAAGVSRHAAVTTVVTAGQPLLLLGLVMHVERKTASYLPQALTSLRREFGDAARDLGLKVGFLVIDVTAAGSASVDAARKTHTDGFFEFQQLNRGPQKPVKGAAQQARDVSAALRMILVDAPSREFQYALLLEDDWVACPGALAALLGGLVRARESFGDELAALRVSYGLNGVIVPKAHLASLSEHIAHLAGGKPPDHAFTAWALKEGELVTYRHNLFVHIGKSSSIGNSGLRWNAACFELLYDFLLANVEAYQVSKCAHDTISPCVEQKRPLPHPQRRAKSFGCDVALQDLHVGYASDRLLACVASAVPLSAKLLPLSRPQNLD